jgi:beta-lactamase regulating signal transducer with metallopeptidase domain
VETLLRIGLSNALASAVLALVAVAMGRVCRRPALVHGLWVLVLFKLVTPPLVDVPIPVPTAANTPTTPQTIAAAAEPAPTLVIEVRGEEGLVVPAADAVAAQNKAAEDGAPVSAEPVPAQSFELPFSWPTVAVGVWLLGSLAWFILAGCRVAQFRRLLEKARPAPVALRAQMQKLSDRLRLTRSPDIVLLPGRLAPLLWCVGGRPLLCLPEGLLGVLDAAALDAILVHELAHLRRGDHLVRGVEFVVLGLYWWHPVAWYARRELREAEEQCCDAWVVTVLPRARRVYAEALLETLDFLSDGSTTVPMPASGVEPVTDLKRRLSMILRGSTPRGLGLSGSLAVLGLAALLPLWPRWAEAQQPDPPPRTPAAADEAKKLEAELQRLQAELQQKMADVKALEARLKAQAERRVLEADRIRKQVREIEVRTKEEAERAVNEARKAAEVRARAQVEIAEERGRAAGDAAKGLRAAAGKRVVVVIEVQGEDIGDKVKEVIAKLKRALPEGVSVSVGDGRELRLSVTAPAIPERPPAPPTPRFARPPQPPGAPAGDLERRLEDLQRELEALRREIRGARPAPPSPPGRPEPPRRP